MRLFPIVPIFGDGKYLQQPIYVDDVASAVLGCLKADLTIGKNYNIAGKHPLTYNEVIDTLACIIRSMSHTESGRCRTVNPEHAAH